MRTSTKCTQSCALPVDEIHIEPEAFDPTKSQRATRASADNIIIPQPHTLRRALAKSALLMLMVDRVLLREAHGEHAPKHYRTAITAKLLTEDPGT